MKCVYGTDLSSTSGAKDVYLSSIRHNTGQPAYLIAVTGNSSESSKSSKVVLSARTLWSPKNMFIAPVCNNV
jgi:hypothetical protein